MERIWYIKRIGREDKFSVCVKAGVPVGLSAWCGRAVCFSSCCGEGGKAYIKEGRTDRCYAIRKTGKCCCRRRRRYRSLRPLGRKKKEKETGTFVARTIDGWGRGWSRCRRHFLTAAILRVGISHYNAFRFGRPSLRPVLICSDPPPSSSSRCFFFMVAATTS